MIPWAHVLSCAQMVAELFKAHYLKKSPGTSKRPLVWNLSRRTLLCMVRSVRPSLSTIVEVDIDGEPG
ncbi:unnamed protein product [Protopolystoma xenopodis]|uniref:Uncharacterized protein n=1 Tax=Protopolystoma xenopodis TaxID=117903 RepID=A0A448X067_9PLAT|nr:unnamed protein product [Protopolystoma xenopodis]